MALLMRMIIMIMTMMMLIFDSRGGVGDDYDD